MGSGEERDSGLGRPNDPALYWAREERHFALEYRAPPRRTGMDWNPGENRWDEEKKEIGKKKKKKGIGLTTVTSSPTDATIFLRSGDPEISDG